MADSPKEKNMPTISPNVYSGIQKWVNRASVSLRGRRRSRNNTDTSVSIANQQEDLLENMTSKPSKIVPVHERSRSTPVEMPNSFAFETFPQKIPRVVKQTKNEHHRKDSSEQSDDSSSRCSPHEAKDTPLHTDRLCSSLSKSESNLLDSRHSRRSKSLPRSHVGHRRKGSLGPALNGGCNGSQTDVTFHNKNYGSSQTLNKANKKDRVQSLEHKANSVGTSKSEQSTRGANTSKNIHSRLDMWVEKTTGLQECRQSSFESTSSSEDIFYESKSRKEETKHCFRDLQSALDELVSSCSNRNSIIKDDQDKIAKGKVSPKETGTMFNLAVNIDPSTREERKALYRKQRGSSSSDSGLAKETHIDDNSVLEMDEKYVSMGEGHDLESSYDSVDGYIDGHEKRSERDMKLHIKDIGPDMNITRGTYSISATGSSEASTNSTDKTNNSKRILTSRPLNNGRQTLGNQKKIRNTKEDSSPNFEMSIQKTCANTSSSNPPEKKKFSLAVFEDDDLEAFAMKCVKASQCVEKVEKRSKSDSDDEKKTALDLDYVYIPKNTEYPTHPTITFDEKDFPFSDDEVYTTSKRDVNISNKTNKSSKRNSEDSLDGLVLFSKEVDVDSNETNSFSSNEPENNKESLKAENDGYGLRKFPSMPLFYVPNDGPRKSRGKSLWKKLKSLPRPSDNLKPRNSQPTIKTDPFYHGDKDQDLESKMRPKSNSMGEAKRRNFRRRLSLLTSAEASSENASHDKSTEKTPPKPLESQC